MGFRRTRTNRINIEKECYYEGLTHAIMEAEKSHNLPSASWRLGKQGGGVPDSDRRPENQGAVMVQVPVQGQEETKSSSTVRKREFNLALPFCSI